MDTNKDNIHNLPQHLYEYLYLLQMVGYFPYLPSSQIDTRKDDRMIVGEVWELGNSHPRYIIVPNINEHYTHLWN